MSACLLDLSVATEAHCQTRLEAAPVIWLGTSSHSGRPHTVPVWFSWDDPHILMFSQPGTVKLRHLGVNDAVSFALDSAQNGTDIVCGHGRAKLGTPSEAQDQLMKFGAKYSPMLGDQTIEQWLDTFSQPVLITVERLITWVRTDDGLDYRSLPEPSPAVAPTRAPS